MSSIDDVKTLLKDHSDDVTVAYHAESGSTTVTATGYLPKAKWQEINQLIKDNGGRYVPKTDGGPKWVFGSMGMKTGDGQITKTQLAHEAIAMLDRHTQEIQAFLKRWKDAGGD
jgi:hypothetical protein